MGSAMSMYHSSDSENKVFYEDSYRRQMDSRSITPILEKSTSICSSGERSSSVSSLTSTSIDTPSDEGTERGKSYKPFSFPTSSQTLEDYIEKACYETIQAQETESEKPIRNLIQPEEEDDKEGFLKWKRRADNTHDIERLNRGSHAGHVFGEFSYDHRQYDIYSCPSCLTAKDSCASCKLKDSIQARGYSTVEKNFPWPNIPYNSLLRNAPDIVLYERDLSQGEESFLPERFVLDWRKKLVQTDIERELNVYRNTSKENIKKKKILPKFTSTSKCKSMGQLPIVGRCDNVIDTRKHDPSYLERNAKSEKEQKLRKTEKEEVTWMQISQLMKESQIAHESAEIRKFLSRRPQMSVTQQTKLKVNMDSDKNARFKVQRQESINVGSPKRKSQAYVKSGIGIRSRPQSLVLQKGSKDFTETCKNMDNVAHNKELKRQNKLETYERTSGSEVNLNVSKAHLESGTQVKEGDEFDFTGEDIPHKIQSRPKNEPVKTTVREDKRQPHKILTVPKIMINETQRSSIESPEVEHKRGPFNDAVRESYRSEVKLIIKPGKSEVGNEEKSFQMYKQGSQDTGNFSPHSSLDDLDVFGSSRSTLSPQISLVDCKRVNPCSLNLPADDMSSSLSSMRGQGFSHEKCLLSTIQDSERRLSASSSHSSTCRSLQTSPVTVIEVNVSQETDSPISPPAPIDEIQMSSYGECEEESKQKLIDNCTETEDSSLPPIVSFSECDRLLDMLLNGNSKIAYIAEDKSIQCTLLQ